MIEFILKSNICFCVSFFCCVIVTKQSENFQLNRVFLLFSILFSLVTPIFSISYDSLNHLLGLSKMSEAALAVSYFSSSISESINSYYVNQNIKLTWGSIVYAIYFLVTAVLVINYAIKLAVLFMMTLKSKKVKYKGTTISIVKNNIPPFNFLNTIFVSTVQYDSGEIKNFIVTHELAHKNQLHSIDRIIIELIQTVFWFNPFIYQMNRLIKLNHEYLADSAVLKTGVCPVHYSKNLMRLSISRNIQYLSNGIKNSSIKKRLIMLSKNKNQKNLTYQFIFIIPIFAIMFFSIANGKVSTILNTDSSGEFYSNTIFWSEDNNKVYLKGNVNVNHGKNKFSGNGSFSFLGQVHLLVINGQYASSDTEINLYGKIVKVIQLSNRQAHEKYGNDGINGAVELSWK